MNDERLQRFEQMLADVQQNQQRTLEQLRQLKAQGRTKSATYRQLLGNKLTNQNLLDLYAMYGLLGG